MKSLFNWNEKNRRNRERALRLESLEDRMLLAVTAGGETAAAVLAADADPMATEAVKLDAPENIQGVSSVNSRITLSWDAVSGASGYTINYRQVGSTDWKTKDTTTASTTITGVLYTKAYEYKIMAKGNGSSYTDSDFSETVKFLANPKYSTVVTTLDDAAISTSPTQITLRQAVYFASQTDGTVTFVDGLEGTIDLAANGQIGLKEILGGFTIDGDNRITVTSSAEDGRGRLFYALATDSAAFNKTITFKNITLDSAVATGYNDPEDGYFDKGDGYNFGSAIMIFCGYSSSKTLSVTVDNVTFTNNTGNGSGTLYVYAAGDVVVNNCTFAGNSSKSGGALFVSGSTGLSIANTSFTGNRASNSGGAIQIDGTETVIDDAVITGNAVYGKSTSSSISGGALYLSGSAGDGKAVTINNTQITDNALCIDPEGENTYYASGKGGAIAVGNTYLTTNQCTISRNAVADCTSALGGAIYGCGVNRYGYDAPNDNYGTIRLNQTYLQDNYAGTYMVLETTGASGGCLYVNGSLILVDSVVTGNEVRGNTTNGLVANAIYSYAAASNTFSCYYTTIAGNRAMSLQGRGLGNQSGAIREFGNSYYWGSVLIGNEKVDMNQTLEDETDDTVTEWNFFTYALEENGVQLPRFLSSVINKDTMVSEDFSTYTHEGTWHWGLNLYTYGTYYDDAAYTQVSSGQHKYAGKYLNDDNINVTDYESFFNDYANGDYTLAKDSVAVDAFNMDLYGGGFGYEYDIRGEGYYRVVNEIVDIGAYELQQSKPTFEVTVNGWTGAYDGQPHTVTIDGLIAGDAVYYSADGITYGADVITYTEVGEYTVYVKVERAGYEDFYGSGDVVIQGSSQKLDAPVISTGKPGVYVSYGANRHQITWGAVANASGYELAYNAGDTWKTMTVTGTSAVVTGLTYESDVQYKVRALGTGSYTDSDYSAVKTFTVCPMDINNDGDIAGADRTLLGNAWLAEEGDENYLPCCDIDGNEEVSGTDRSFLVKNWLCEVGEDELAYPKPLNAGDAAIAEFVSEFDIDLDVF